MIYREMVRAQLKSDEGVKSKPDRETVGKLTIGCGRNLDDVGLSLEEINLLLDNDIRRAENDARTLFPGFDDLSDNRKAVLINMSFNMGRERLAQFRKLRRAVEEKDFDQAYVEMIASLWADQVGPRATRLAKQMKEG
jgi:lysozyme